MLLRHSVWVVFFKVLIASFRVNFFPPEILTVEFKDSLATFNQIILSVLPLPRWLLLCRSSCCHMFHSRKHGDCTGWKIFEALKAEHT